MELLNDDIVFHILKFTSINDQFNLKYALPQLEKIIEKSWKIQFKKRLYINFVETPLSANELIQLLTQSSKTVRMITVKFINLEIFQIFTSFTYEQLKDFRFIQTPNNEIRDEHLLILKNVFPKLRALSPHGQHLTGQYIYELWPNLEHLSLRHCSKVCASKINEILENLQLQSFEFITPPSWSGFTSNARRHFWKLQHLIIDCDMLDYLMEENFLAYMHHLRELKIIETVQFTSMVFLIQKIYAHKRFKFLEEHLIMDNVLPISAIQPGFDKLRRFTLAYNIFQEPSVFPSIVDGLIQEFSYNQFFELREVMLTKLVIYRQEEIIRLLTNALYLELISLEYCRMRFNVLCLYLDEILPKQRTPITLNFYNNFCTTPETARAPVENLKVCSVHVIGNSRMVKITANPLYVPPDATVKLIFDPDD